MANPRVLVLRAPGTNCDLETAHAFERAGAVAERLHVNRLREQPSLLDSFQILCLPGGFSYGDDVSAGRILGNQIRVRLADDVRRFRDAGKLVLGICNGFQILLKSGILLEDDVPASGGPATAQATLALNESGRYEDRWVRVGTQGSKCVFFSGVESMYLPVAHAEGKFVPRDAAVLAKLESGGQACLKYRPLDENAPSPPAPLPQGARGAGLPVGANHTVPYPDNPNGATNDIAAVCDPTGRVCGLMPHPERHLDAVQHPQWTRMKKLPPAGDGFVVFQNAVRYFL